MATSKNIHVDIIASARLVPSVGRVVHFQPIGNPGAVYPPAAAMITFVSPHPDQLNVSLAILTPLGLSFDVAVPFADTPTPGCWSWPPRI